MHWFMQPGLWSHHSLVCMVLSHTRFYMWTRKPTTWGSTVVSEPPAHKPRTLSLHLWCSTWPLSSQTFVLGDCSLVEQCSSRSLMEQDTDCSHPSLYCLTQLPSLGFQLPPQLGKNCNPKSVLGPF